MKLFTNIFITWKPLTIFAKSFILDNWLGSRNATGISKVTSYKCTRKENTYAKMQSKYCQSGIESCVMQKLVQPNNLNIYYEIFGEKAVFKFLRRHAWQRPLLSGVQLAARNITDEKRHQRYFPATYLRLQLLPYPWDNCDQLPLKLPCLLRGNTSPI